MAKKKDVEVKEEDNVEALTGMGEQPKKEVWPTCEANGRFQAVRVKDGVVVFNPKGQRATGVITEDAGRNLVREYNRAIGIKVKAD